MKSFTTAMLCLVVATCIGCGQRLVEFVDQGANADLGVGDLAGRDLSAANDLAGPDLAGADFANNNNNSDGGDGDGFIPVAPEVMSVTPMPMAMMVATFRVPTATFTKSMSSASLNNLSFTLKEEGAITTLTGVVTYDDLTHTARFSPQSPLSSARPTCAPRPPTPPARPARETWSSTWSA